MTCLASCIIVKFLIDFPKNLIMLSLYSSHIYEINLIIKMCVCATYSKAFFLPTIQRHKFLSSSHYENYETMWHISRSFISYSYKVVINFSILVIRAFQKRMERKFTTANCFFCFLSILCYVLLQIEICLIRSSDLFVMLRVKVKSCWEFYHEIRYLL